MSVVVLDVVVLDVVVLDIVVLDRSVVGRGWYILGSQVVDWWGIGEGWCGRSRC